jgi:non-ribosomal peptide synthetase component F
LQKLGVPTGSRVAIALDRSPELVISLIAILKAGGAYVAIDADFPGDRLKMMLGDIEPQAIITQTKYRNLLAACAGKVSLLAVDEPGDLSNESEENLTNSCGPEDLAYISFTSGSTGRPKGVCIPHRGVVRLVKNTDYVSIAPSDTFLQLAPIAFDASTFEIWGALLNGARLVIHPPGLPGLHELGSFIENEQVTTLWLTAGLFQ